MPVQRDASVRQVVDCGTGDSNQGEKASEDPGPHRRHRREMDPGRRSFAEEGGDEVVLDIRERGEERFGIGNVDPDVGLDHPVARDLRPRLPCPIEKIVAAVMPPIAELRQSHLLDDSIVEDHLGDARRHGNGAASLVRSDDKIQ